MAFAARAPGKLVVLGEYAVLAGADALVVAVDRHCTAAVAPLDGERCEIETRAGATQRCAFTAGQASGIALVDHVIRAFPAAAARAGFRASIDSQAFFSNGAKLGLGSSAAALVAFAGAWSAHVAGAGPRPARPDVATLIECHRAFQGGAGSGLDVAAAVTGGVIQFRLDPDALPVIGSVRLPNSVGFAGVFTGVSASTPDFVQQFERWRSASPARSKPLLQALKDMTEAGCAAARGGDARGFVEAVESYGELLERLGQQIGRSIVTAPHREVGALARRFGVAYKTSGAGGGDLGIAFCADPAALTAFGAAVVAAGFEWVELGIDQDGLVIEEQRSE